MTLPHLGIIGTGAFGTALRHACKPLIGKQIQSLQTWETPQERPQQDPEILILAIPSTALNGDKLAILDYIEKFTHTQIIITSKGRQALKIFRNHVSPADKPRIFSLSGPNLADQITHTPTATILAGDNLISTTVLAQTLTSTHLQIFPSASLEVVQRGGMLKNFLVFELGKIWTKLDTPNKQIHATILALKTGFHAINDHVPQSETKKEFFSISGLGDILLCLGIFCELRGSRNFRAGKMIAAGSTQEEILNKYKTLEGLQTSIKFHSPSPPEFLQSNMMNEFRNFILSPQLPLPSPEPHDHINQLSQELWQHFQHISRQKNFQSNTHAWIFCEIIQELSCHFSIPLTNFETAEPLLHATLNAVFHPSPSITLTPQGENIWNTLTQKLPFLYK